MKRYVQLLAAAPGIAVVSWLGTSPDARPGFVATGHVTERIAINDNRIAAGTLRDGVLTVRLEARAGEWQPDREAGLSGAIVVLEPGASFNPEKDVVLLISTPRRDADRGVVLLNGTNAPAQRDWRVGERYRLRLVNIHTYRPSMIARLVRDSTLLTWRAIAKDGMDLPPDQATVRPALQQSGNGETFDFEFRPDAPGDLRFTVSAANGLLLVTMPIRVR
ncbi:MAG: hypothetical protein ACT4P7_21340 [Gemmatimonadaceae bacterium]